MNSTVGNVPLWRGVSLAALCLFFSLVRQAVAGAQVSERQYAAAEALARESVQAGQCADFGNSHENYPEAKSVANLLTANHLGFLLDQIHRA